MVPIALFGWPILAVALFALLEQRQAVLVAFIGACLFLPIAHYEIPGIPDYTKESAASIGVMAGTLLFARSRLFPLRIHWIDFPVILFCLWPATSSLSTGKGGWDAISAIIQQTTIWGMPYLFGRIYFTDLQSLRMMTKAVIIGGLIYVPLCLFEVRMSPQLHIWVYGFHQHSFAQTIRFGGFRPVVFMEHGLAVSMWMISATLLTIWMSLTSAMRRVGGVPINTVIGVLVVTCVLCKSTGALSLLLIGIGTGLLAKASHSSLPLKMLIAIAPVWMISRTFDLFSGQFVSDLFVGLSADRAASFVTRLKQEDEILKIALQHYVFGGSRWFDEGADQQWLLCFRNFGAVGLTAMTGIFLLPGFVILKRFAFHQLVQPALAPLVGMSMILILHMTDNLLNAMNNPVFTMMSGALGAVIASGLAEDAVATNHAAGRHTRTMAISRKLWPPRISV